MEESGVEARTPWRVREPGDPTPEERAQHELTHLPFRSWCRFCVMGRGRQEGHFRQSKKESSDNMPEISLDYAFPASEGGVGVTMLVARERRTRMTCATVVPKKGTTGAFAAKRINAFLRELGVDKMDVILKSDGEPAIKAVIDDVAALRPTAKTIREEAPRASSGSNGIVERAIQSVTHQVKVLKLWLEEKWGQVIPDEHPVVPWVVEYVAVLLNRCEISRDGHTAYRRMKGKDGGVKGIAFGEKVLFRRKPLPNRLSKMSTLWEDGIYLGMRTVSGEMIVGTAAGVWRTRTVQRRPLGERWAADAAGMVGGVPWHTSEDDEDADGPSVKVTLGERLTEQDAAAQGEIYRDTAPRRVQITRADLEKHGFTKGCLGCRAWLAGKPRQGHSEECRKRMEAAMVDDPRAKAARKRENVFIEKALEAEDKKRKAAGEGECARQAPAATASSSGAAAAAEARGAAAGAAAEARGAAAAARGAAAASSSSGTTARGAAAEARGAVAGAAADARGAPARDAATDARGTVAGAAEDARGTAADACCAAEETLATAPGSSKRGAPDVEDENNKKVRTTPRSTKRDAEDEMKDAEKRVRTTPRSTKRDAEDEMKDIEDADKRPRIQSVSGRPWPSWEVLEPGAKWADIDLEQETDRVYRVHGLEVHDEVEESDHEREVHGAEVNDEMEEFGCERKVRGMEVNDEAEEHKCGVRGMETNDEEVEMDPEELREAREEELSYIDKIAMYEEATLDECWRETGKSPIGTKWVDVLKDSDGRKFVRSRLVAKDFREKDDRREELFAATPPLDTLKALLSLAHRDGLKVLVLDVKKAHLNGVVKPEDGRHYVQAPDERRKPGMCWRLRRWLYGMRPAARAWEDDYAERLEAEGMLRGKAAPTCFWSKALQTRALVHGDDFVIAGPDAGIRYIQRKMMEWYEVKIRAILGTTAGDDKEIVILGRTVRWGRLRVEIEADVKHGEIIREQVGIQEDSKSLAAPSARNELDDIEDGRALDRCDARWYRGVAARANYLGLDRADLQFAVKEACKGMAAPTAKDARRVKRIARYILGVPRVILRSGDEPGEKNAVKAFVDSDWAGCKTTRKSTSGGILTVGGMAVKTWSSTQGSVATSSGEAEYYALVRGSAEALGLAAAMADLGWVLKVQVHVDSSAAKAVASRVGLGKTRHIEVRYLWLQEAVRRRRLEIRKIKGQINPADALTKPKGTQDFKELLGRVNICLQER